MKVSNILAEDDLELFKDLFRETISLIYPSSTGKTVESIILKHKLGVDPDGYFTIRKTIWKGVDEENKIVAFTVISEKRGGSIKFGPTIVPKALRGHGYGSIFRSLVEQEYANKGYRKSYSTTNVSNIPAIFYILKIGYKIELHLKKHYSVKGDELVLSKIIDKGGIIPQPSSLSIANVPKYILDYLLKYYDGIDDIFFQNIDRAITNSFEFDESFFVSKKKHEFSESKSRQYALVTPKRGNCAKIFPLILNESYDSNTIFIKKILQAYANTPIHKFYTFVPIDRWSDVNFLKDNGFYIEGVITEPYRRGVDLIMLSFLKF